MLTRMYCELFLEYILMNFFLNNLLIFFTFCCKVDKEEYAYLSGI